MSMLDRQGPCDECEKVCFRFCHIGSKTVCAECFGKHCEKTKAHKRTEKASKNALSAMKELYATLKEDDRFTHKEGGING